MSPFNRSVFQRPCRAMPGRLALCIVAATVAVLAATGVAAAMTLTLATAGTHRSSSGQAALRFADHVGQLSAGAMAIEIVPAAGGIKQLWADVREGRFDLHLVDIGAIVLLPQGREMNVLWTPFLFRDQDHYRRFVRSDLFRHTIDAIDGASGIQFLGQVGDKPPRIITNSRGPILSVRDVQGLKIPIAPNPIFARTYLEWGALPLPMNGVQFHAALLDGMVDAQDNGLIDFVRSRELLRMHRYVAPINWAHSGDGLWIGRERWNTLNEQEQRWLRLAAAHAADDGEAVFAAQSEQASRILAEHGTEVSDPDLDSFRFVKDRIVVEMEGHFWPFGLVNKISQLR